GCAPARADGADGSAPAPAACDRSEASCDRPPAAEVPAGQPPAAGAPAGQPPAAGVPGARPGLVTVRRRGAGTDLAPNA
ncbi:biotin synthase BioB, partial [Streptomyces sp. NPDC055078]